MNVRGWLTQNQKTTAFAGIALLLIVALSAYNSVKGGDKKNRQDPVKAAVEVVTANRSDMTKKISLVGQTVAAAQVDIVAKYSGRVQRIEVELGQPVKAGQILLVQELDDLNISIAQADAAKRQADADAAETAATFGSGYSKASVDYQHSLANYQRYKSLYEIGAISKESFDSMEQQMLTAKAALDSYTNQSTTGAAPAAVESKRAAAVKAERTVDALVKQRDDMMIRAPWDGVIGYRQAEVGAYLPAGQKILSLVDNSHLYVDCQVSEQDVAALQLGQTATLQIDALGRSYAGKIIFISPAADSKTQVFTVRLQLTDTDAGLKSGMFVRSMIEVLQRPQTLYVPKEALIEKNGQQSIYIIKNDGKAEPRKVTVGLRNDRDVEILSGLNEGEQVATTNLSRLRPGMEVTVAAHDATQPQQGVQP